MCGILLDCYGKLDLVAWGCLGILALFVCDRHLSCAPGHWGALGLISFQTISFWGHDSHGFCGVFICFPWGSSGVLREIQGTSLTCAHQDDSLAPRFMYTYLHVQKQPFRLGLGDLGLGADLGTRRHGVGIKEYINNLLGWDLGTWV
jgi:hypothetical protein